MARIHKEDIDRFFDYDIHLGTRTIFIGDDEDRDGVGPKMAEKAIKALHLLETADHSKPITIILNSAGGSVYDGFAIYDAIRSSPCHILIKAYGSCMSMATVILQAADERVLAQNTTFMIHDGYQGIECASPKTFQAWAAYGKYSATQMYEIFAMKSGKDSKFWEKKCANDFIMTAEEAVELGLADKVLGKDEEVK